MPAYSSLPGFRDFYPDDFSVRARITGAWREVSRRYGYEEYDGPPLESLELYVDKSGEEIVGQLYEFVDKGGRAVALRPEMTPTLARMVAARAGGLRKPIRWFSVPQLFRYERAQRGRLREHYQWNADIVGESDVAADAEVLAVALDGLRLLGLGEGDVIARVSDRRLLERLLIHAGVPQDQLAATYAILDKLGREAEERTRERLGSDAGLGPGAVAEIFRIFGHASFGELASAYGDVKGVKDELDRLGGYFDHLNDMGLGALVRFDPAIVRGLAYYTGIVFEIFDSRGELRAVCGGGRYDNLLRALGGPDLPALGFGMGDVVLAELLKERGLLPDYRPEVDRYVVAITEAERPLVRRLAHRLRDAGVPTLYSLRAAGVGWQFKDAAARGAREAVVLGPDEAAAGTAVVRDMASGKERRVTQEELLS